MTQIYRDCNSTHGVCIWPTDYLHCSKSIAIEVNSRYPPKKEQKKATQWVNNVVKVQYNEGLNNWVYSAPIFQKSEV